MNLQAWFAVGILIFAAIAFMAVLSGLEYALKHWRDRD